MNEKSDYDIFNEFLIKMANAKVGIRRKIVSVWQVSDAIRKGYQLEEKESIKEYIDSANKFIKTYYEKKVEEYSKELEKINNKQISIETAKKIIFGGTE